MRKISIGIIGAGWYGCHIGSKLKRDGFDVAIYEQNEQIFQGASRFNQNRLHLGFHYPRCSKTRAQSRRGFHLFQKEYPDICMPLDYNLFATHKESLIDFETYSAIMRSESLVFQDVTETCPVRLNQTTGVIDCPEMYIDPDKASTHFSNELGTNLQCGMEITPSIMKSMSRDFDFIIDCTWGGIPSNVQSDIYYEACVYFIIESEHFGRTAVTVMDGPFFSIFPHGVNQYTFTSVGDIAVAVETERGAAVDSLLNWKSRSEKWEPLWSKYVKVASDVIPDFSQRFKFKEVNFALKTKFKNGSDSRFVRIDSKDNLISVQSGKIDTIFDAYALVRREMGV